MNKIQGEETVFSDSKIEIEKCHLATIIVIIDSRKNHQWVLILVDKKGVRN